MYPKSMATEIFRQALDLANQAAVEFVETEFVGSEHFIYAFLSLPTCEAYKILTSAGIQKEAYGAHFYAATKGMKADKGLTPNTQKMYDRAVEAAQMEGMYATTAHMLNEILAVPSCCAVRYLRRCAGESLAEQKALVEDILQKTESAINLLIYKKKQTSFKKHTKYVKIKKILIKMIL